MDGDGIVGWPPIKSWRKRLCHENHVVRPWNNACGGRVSNSMYVKVKMDGVGIARKVDLSQHDSFETLTETLMDMFSNCKYIYKVFVEYVCVGLLTRNSTEASN